MTEYVYTVYKVTNTINGKYYVGVHKTKTPNDRYLGSGDGIKSAIKKYGRQNFIKEILFVFDIADDAYEKEAELVSEEVVSSGNCYNRHVGGFGKGISVANRLGLNNKNKTEEHFNKRKDGYKRWADANKANPTISDTELLAAYKECRSINKAIASLGSNSRPLRQRLSALLKNLYGVVPSKPGPVPKMASTSTSTREKSGQVVERQTPRS